MASDMSNPPKLSLCSIHVLVTVAPENVDAFLAAFRPLYEAIVAEPENVYFEVFQNPESPGEFKFIENWNASVEWLMSVQIQKPYYAACEAITGPMFLKPREIEFWSRMPNDEWRHVKQ